MAKYFVYYNEETQDKFCTVYEWNGRSNDTTRRYCSYIGDSRYTHAEIQLDVDARILTDKRTGSKHALIAPRKEDKKNLQWESVEMTPVEWEDAF